jgi:hypothetical protein
MLLVLRLLQGIGISYLTQTLKISRDQALMSAAQSG